MSREHQWHQDKTLHHHRVSEFLTQLENARPLFGQADWKASLTSNGILFSTGCNYILYWQLSKRPESVTHERWPFKCIPFRNLSNGPCFKKFSQFSMGYRVLTDWLYEWSKLSISSCPGSLAQIFREVMKTAALESPAFSGARVRAYIKYLELSKWIEMINKVFNDI